MEWFDQYVYFLAKALTVLVVVALILAMIAAGKARSKRTEGTLSVTRLNDRLQRMHEQLGLMVLSKGAARPGRSSSSRRRRPATRMQPRMSAGAFMCSTFMATSRPVRWKTCAMK